MDGFTPKDTKLILSRLKKLIGIKTDEQLAQKLDISKGTVNSWKTRGNFSLPLIVKAIGRVDLNYIIYGNQGVEIAERVSETYNSYPISAKIIHTAEPASAYLADYVPGSATGTLLNKIIRAVKLIGEDPDIMKKDIFGSGDALQRRIIEWFSDAYDDNYREFADEYGVAYDVFDAFLKGIYPLTIELANYMMISGCDMDWLIYGTGSKYNNFTQRGRFRSAVSKAKESGTASEYVDSFIALNKKQYP